MLHQYLEEKKELINEAIDSLIPEESTQPSKIHQAMRYSALADGKRLRPILVLISAEMNGLTPEQVLPSAVGIELIHCYSLIHDDLPCMDDDDYRRGQLTNHMVFGEALAVLAGDALLTHAFSLFVKNSQKSDIKTSSVLKVIDELSYAVGSRGLIGGQVVDLMSEGSEVDQKTLTYIHKNKTAALLEAALKTGAILGEASLEKVKALSFYGEQIGLAFQITDDMLDISGDREKMGKEPGTDLHLDKATYPKVYGYEDSKTKAFVCVERAKESLSLFGKDADLLKQLADYILKREH